MINNLFNIFDPSSSMLNINWLSLMFIFFFPLMFWKLRNKGVILLNLVINNLSKEINSSTNPFKHKGITMLIISIFISILLVNFIGLYPYIFTPTSHIMLTFPLALIVWRSLMIFGWFNNYYHIFIHIVPQGTPYPLIIFIVIIEIIRNIIRPLTLAVRLSANIIAGHLLISLLRNFLKNIYIKISIPISSIIIILMILEIAVSIIQAYVFITLSTLYSNEVH